MGPGAVPQRDEWSAGRRAVLLLAAAMLLPLARSGAQGAAAPPRAEDFVRPPAVAGQFYPGDPSQLDGAVRDLLAEALPPRG